MAKKRDIFSRGRESILGSTELPSSNVIDVEMDCIRLPKAQPRHDKDAVHLEELKASIQKYGLLNPITVVFRNEHDEYQRRLYTLVAGEQRYRAVRDIGVNTIRAVVLSVNREYGSREFDNEIQYIAYEENERRDNLTLMDRAQWFALMVDDRKVSPDELARRLKCDDGTVYRWLQVAKSRSYLANMLKPHGLTVNDIPSLSLALRLIKILSDGKGDEESRQVIIDLVKRRAAEDVPENDAPPSTAITDIPLQALSQTERREARKEQSVTTPTGIILDMNRGKMGLSFKKVKDPELRSSYETAYRRVGEVLGEYDDASFVDYIGKHIEKLIKLQFKEYSARKRR